MAGPSGRLPQMPDRRTIALLHLRSLLSIVRRKRRFTEGNEGNEGKWRTPTASGVRSLVVAIQKYL